MGRPQFEQVVANAPKEKLVYADFTKTDSLAAGSTDSVSLFAPSGYVGEVVSMYLMAPSIPTSTTGTHTFILGYPGFDVTRGQGAYSGSLTWNNNCWQSATSSQSPPSDQTQSSAVRGSMFDDITGIRVLYYNSTDKTQTNPRNIRILYRLRQVSK